MKTVFSIFFLFFVLISNSIAQFTYTNKDNNATLNLEPGAKQEIVIQLTQNGGTAYMWKVVKNNELVCKFEKEETVPVDPAILDRKQAVGTPVIRQFHFKTTGKGGLSQIKIQLVTSSGEVAEAFNFNVKSPYPAKTQKRKK